MQMLKQKTNMDSLQHCFKDLEVVKYLYETCHAKIPDDTISKVSIKDNLEVVKYLYERQWFNKKCFTKWPS